MDKIHKDQIIEIFETEYPELSNEFKSIQIEIQTNVRKKLATNNKFLNKFASILKNIYKELKPICNIKTKKVKRKKKSRRNKTRRKR